MSAFGMPGPGGSLGECALCGEPFVTEILLGRNVASFKVSGCATDLFGHHKCLKEFQGKTMLNLPAKSALRQAYEKQQESQPANPKKEGE
jgi:hypothetical protein